MSAIKTLATAGQIASQLGQPIHRVLYVIRSRGIVPVGVAGGIRVFSDSDVARIDAEIRQIDEEAAHDE